MSFCCDMAIGSGTYKRLDMVLYNCNGFIRDNRIKGNIKMERKSLKTFLYGSLAGFITAVIVFSIGAGIVHLHNKEKEKIKYAEKQIEIEALREEVSNLIAGNLLDTFPDVRGAADNSIAEFDRKRDEAIQRFRSGFVNK